MPLLRICPTDKSIFQYIGICKGMLFIATLLVVVKHQK